MRTRELRRTALLVPLVAVLVPGLPGAAQEVTDAVTGAPQVTAPSRVVTGSRTIAAGEEIPEIVVVGGDLRVQGEVTGNAIVVGGDLILDSTGVIHGDAVVTGGTIRNEGGRILGEMRSIQGEGLDVAGAIQRSIGGNDATAASTRPRAETRARAGARASRDGGWFDPIRRGMAGIISTLAFGLVLAGVGAVLVFYGRPYLETVSDTVRGATLRSAATGLAASFLVLPAFVVMVVALAVSIVGIPLLLVAIPLYPLAIFAAVVFGLLGASHAIGERTTEQSRDGLDLRYRNSYAYLFTGLGMLLLPHIGAHMVSMTGFLGFIGMLLRIVTVLAIWAAATVGFGAVLLSRAGTRRTFVAMPPDVVGYETDDLFADEPVGGQGHA
jgi:hypothetical protein